MNPIDAVLNRLDNPKPTGRDRWRSACPACGGNRSALSVGIGSDDAVLLRCWKGCDVEGVVHAMGLDLNDLFPPRATDHGVSPLKRRGMLTASQCLEVMNFECLLISTAAFNLANGHALTADDLQRLAVAGQRIQALISEVRA